MPSCPGIFRSDKTVGTSPEARRSSSAWSAEAAARTVYPSSRRTVEITCLTEASSSTTRIVEASSPEICSGSSAGGRSGC